MNNPMLKDVQVREVVNGRYRADLFNPVANTMNPGTVKQMNKSYNEFQAKEKNDKGEVFVAGLGWVK